MNALAAWWRRRKLWQQILLGLLLLGVVVGPFVDSDDGTQEASPATTSATTSPEAPSTTEAAVTSTAAPTTTKAPTTTTSRATTTTARYSEDDPEFLLAAIDKGSVSVSDAEVRPYEQVLDRLELKCTQSRSMIGDMAVRSVELLEEQGLVGETNLTMMEAVDLAIPDGMEMDCAEIYAAIITIMANS